MDIRQLTPRYFVAPQISPEDMAAYKEAGIARILCNRPDEEVPPALGSEAMKAAAEAAGLEFAMQPLTHSTMTEENVMRNREIGLDKEGVTLAYCASGTRSSIAWALGQAGLQSADEIIKAAQSAGYDLENMRGYLQQHES
ncbi:TIGR01244 family phosphatase [Sulfitobacter sp. S223]|uniref:TIGR01244 family sulfur transferase n=1 Tax=Sulfitobacter sp. S223 TaxID=2867023 RepID=UPI0021A4C184|nr:TIGR01244 family sulfur transferase [Sulfitobacter sp. S223]UWR24964.1 TIGR01244 family phosphatase [Sulfitobacter sp. S223]